MRFTFPHSLPNLSISDMCAFGMIGGGGGGSEVGPTLLGVVEAVLCVLGGAVTGAAADHRAPQQAEGGAYPAGVQRETEGHEAMLMVHSNWEPHR